LPPALLPFCAPEPPVPDASNARPKTGSLRISSTRCLIVNGVPLTSAIRGWPCAIQYLHGVIAVLFKIRTRRHNVRVADSGVPFNALIAEVASAVNQ
jgi:hypothetical protein